MRSRILLLIMAVCTMALTSCEKTYYEIEELHPKVVLLNVNQNSWKYSYNNPDNNNYFYATVAMPEISRQAFTNGLVKMYRVYDWGTPKATQIEMPYVRLNEQYVPSMDQWFFYTETVDYQFQEGAVEIYYTQSDFEYEIDEEFVPAAMQFRCVIYE